MSRQRNPLLRFTEPQSPPALDNAVRLPLARVDANPDQARQVFDETALHELADSIREHGVLEPILVRPVGERYQVVAGERRVRAARLAGLLEVPAIIRELDDQQAAYITAVENLQRADLDIEDEARWFNHLLTLTGLSQRELAEKLGIQFNYLSRRVRLLQRPELLAAVRSGELPLLRAMDIISSNSPWPLPEPDLYLGDTDPATDTLPVERAALDKPPRATPTAFRWRPWQQFAAVVAKTRGVDVPPQERATFRAQVAQLRAKLEALEAELGEE